MASYDDLVSIAFDSTFQGRVRYALSVAAAAVYSESQNTAGHSTRAQFANKVSKGEYDLGSISFLVLSNATIASEAVKATTPDFAIPDDDIQFSVNSLWNLFAGA